MFSPSHDPFVGIQSQATMTDVRARRIGGKHVDSVKAHRSANIQVHFGLYNEWSFVVLTEI